MLSASRLLPICTFVAAGLLVPLAGVPPEEADGPCLVLTRSGGRNPNGKSGLVLAVWDDGTMLFAANRDAPGERLLVGRAEKAEVEGTIEAIRAAGFFSEKREHYAVPDSAATTIMVRKGKERAIHTWHENLLPGFGGDINTDQPYRSFVRMWKKTSGAIEGLPPITALRLEETAKGETFRGYDPGNPRNTGWMQARAWRN